MVEYVKVANLDDIPPGEVRSYTVDGNRIAVCHADGELYAIDDVCTHDGGALDQGFLEGYEIECPRHGARFDIRSGKALTLPAILPVKTYDVKVEANTILVALQPTQR